MKENRNQLSPVILPLLMSSFIIMALLLVYVGYNFMNNKPLSTGLQMQRMTLSLGAFGFVVALVSRFFVQYKIKKLANQGMDSKSIRSQVFIFVLMGLVASEFAVLIAFVSHLDNHNFNILVLFAVIHIVIVLLSYPKIPKVIKLS